MLTVRTPDGTKFTQLGGMVPEALARLAVRLMVDDAILRHPRPTGVKAGGLFRHHSPNRKPTINPPETAVTRYGLAIEATGCAVLRRGNQTERQ